MRGGKRIYVLCANPVKGSFSYRCADAYQKAARAVGATVRRADIAKMDFDPVLHQGYSVIQELEPALCKFQENITWAEHLVFIYPNWWSTMPAKMKGLFDRSFLPGFAFRFVDGVFVPKLGGRTARVINIVGSLHPFLLRCVVGDCTNELANGVLKSCGVRPVTITQFGPTRSASGARKERWLKRVGTLAQRDAAQ